MIERAFIGFHYDIARGAYLKPDMFCQALRLAAASGYTHFLPYLENMIRLPSMEKACPSCAYTAEDWRRFEAVAKDAGIALVPHFNVVGHSVQICGAYPELSGNSGDGELDVTLEVTKEWILRCLEEYCQFAGGAYFLIGGDEWQPPRHLLAKPDFDPGETWARHMNQAIEFLRQKGRCPIVWHDMLLHYPSALPLLSREAIIAFWFYDEDSDYPALSMLKEWGFRVLMASGLSGMLGTREVNAVNCAITAVRTHKADGFLMTTWEDARWERQTFNIPAVTELLRHKALPESILRTVSLISAWRRLPKEVDLAMRWRTQIERGLCDTVWDPFPELRRSLRAIIRGDITDEVASFTRFHAAQGPTHQRILSPSKPKLSAFSPARRHASSMHFGLEVCSYGQSGPVLRFSNGPESFEIYPKYGASLQNWRKDDIPVIPHTIEAVQKPDGPLPGGYRSYTAAGGFRPIWALGTHSNPCILWQHPFEWSVEEQTSERIAVRMTLELQHVAVRYEVMISNGQSGFDYRATAINKLPVAYGTFDFNLLIARQLSDLNEGPLIWQDAGQVCRTTVEQKGCTAFWIPAREALSVGVPAGVLCITAEPSQTAGFFVDWAPNYITPDVHGIYRRLTAGESLVARWQLVLKESADAARDSWAAC